MRSDPLRQASGGDAEEVHALRARVADLQAKVEELSGKLQLKELEAENQQERSDCLEIMLKKLGEKDDTTELLLEQLTEENQELTRKLLAAQDSVMDKEHLIRNLEERCEELEEQLTDNRRTAHDLGATNASSDAHDALVQENDSMRDELYHAREVAQNLERDLFARTAAFEQRLTSLEKERDDLRNSLTVERSKASFHTDDVESKQYEVDVLESRLNSIVEMVKNIYPSFLRNMQDVEFQIDSRLENMDARLSESAEMLYTISTTLPLGRGEQEEDSLAALPISRPMLERTLRETQLALQDACSRHQEDEEHIQRLSDDLHHMQEEKQFHLGTIQELERQVAALRNVTHAAPSHSHGTKPPLPPPHASTSAVEVSDLKARLCAVESRAEKAAAEHAKLYAQHVRMIAYLESECSRLRGLGDHFRAMNVKLMADLKKAKLQGLKCRGLENRITILAENEKKMVTKLHNAERSLMERNEEILALIREKESEDRHKALRYDEEINSVHEQVETLHRQLQDSARNYEALLSKYHAMEHDYKSELHQFQLQLDHSEHESMLHNRRAEELALELQTTLEQLKEREHSLAQCEMKLELAIQNSEVNSSNYERTLRELSTELEERVAKLETMEETVQSLKQKILLLEDDLLTRNKESATKLIERSQFENELQQYRDALQEQQAMTSSLQQTNALLSNQNQTWKRQLEALEEQYQNLTDNHMKTLSERAMRAETALHQMREELKEKKDELQKQDELLMATRASLQEVENTLQRVQSDYISLETNEQLLRASNETLVEENEMFRTQIQEVLQQHSTLTQKYLTKNSEFNTLLDRVEELENRNLTMTRKEEEYKALIVQLEARELHYIDELEGIAIAFSTVDEALDSSLAILPSPFVKRSEVHEASPSKAQLMSPAAQHGSGGSGGVHSPTGGSVLNQISTLRNKSSAVMTLLTTYQQKSHSFAATLEVLTNEREHLKSKMEKMEAEKLELLNAVHKSEGQVKELQEAMAKLRHYVGTCEDNHVAQKRRLLEQLLQFGSTIQGSGAQMMKLLEGETNALMDAHTVLSEFREIHNLLTVRDDLLNNEDESSSSDLQRYISTFYTKTENLYLLCLQMVSTSIEEKHRVSASMEETQAALNQSKEAHQAALEMQRQQMQGLEEDNLRLTQELTRFSQDMDDLQAELGSFRQINGDLHEQRSILDQELQSTAQINQDLSNSLKSMELTNNELTNEIKRLTSEIATKDTSIRQYQEQQQLLRKRVNETDLNFEKLNSMIQRLRGEKEALESVVGSLESELDRSRSDYLAIINKYNPSSSEDRGYMFELEKLLAALHSTSDQIEENFGGLADVSASQMDMVSVVTTMEGGAAGSQADGSLFEIQKRVEQAVARLTRIRTRTREEGRSRRMVERQLGQLNDEIKKLLAVIEGHEANLNRCDKELADTRDVLKAREQEINELNANLLLFQSNEQEIKDKYSLLESVLNDTKKENISLTEELHNKLAEANRVAREMESLEAAIHKLQSELQVVKLEHQQALLDCEQRGQQLKAARDNHQQVLTALEQCEENLNRERALRSQLESRLQQGEEANGLTFQNQLSLLSSDLDAKNEEIRNLLHSKVLQDGRVHSMEQELQLARQTVSILEMRLENSAKEMAALTDEAAETKRKVQQAKESYEVEKSLRLRSEAAISALRRVQDDDKRKLNMEGLVVIRNNETESLHLLAEEEKKILRSKIVELKQLCDEKEIMYHHEASEKKRLEKELEASAHTLSKKASELHTANQYVQLFRKEGRVVRKDVMEVMALLNEVIQAVSLDLQYGFVDFNISATTSMTLLNLSEGFTWDSSAGGAGEGGAGKLPSSLKLPEAVGLPTLFEMVRKLKEMMGRYCGEYNRYKAMIQQQSDLETERNALLKQVVSLQESSKVATQQWSEEKKMYQAQVLKMKNNDQNTEQTHRLLQQVASLEAALKKEKERKERALQEVKEARNEVDRLSGRGGSASSVSHLAKDRNPELDEEAANLQMEVHRLHNENLALRQDIHGWMTQAQTMKEMVEQMDRKVKMAADAGSLAFHSSHSISGGAGASSFARRGNEDGGGEWLLTRFQVRCKAMEELAAIYRQALLTVSPEGPGAKLHAYNQVLSEEGLSVALLRQATAWIEKEIHTVRASYEEEIHFFETHVQDLYTKLKERQAYEVELRKQLEDATKSFYQRSLTSNTMSEQLLSLRREVERSHADLQSMQEEWMKERKHSRLRHVQLVEDLTNALEAREVALLALRKLEQHCHMHGWDIKHYAVFEELHREAIRSTAAEDVLEGPMPFSPTPSRRSHASSPATAPSMSNIIRGIIEADHELQEAEKRGRDRRRDPGSASRLRATSNTSSRSAGTGVGTALASPNVGTPVAKLDALRMQREEQASAVYHSTLLSHHGGSATVEGTLTETFLTNRFPPQSLAQPPPPPPATSTSTNTGPGASASTASRKSQSHIPSYKGSQSYAMPTAANSSGQSFLRVARSQAQRDL